MKKAIRGKGSCAGVRAGGASAQEPGALAPGLLIFFDRSTRGLTPPARALTLLSSHAPV